MVQGLNIQVYKKIFRVYAGICPAAACGFNGLAQQCCECFIKQFLHGYGVWLHLPAMVIGTIISQFNKISLGVCHVAKLTSFTILDLPIPILSLLQLIIIKKCYKGYNLYTCFSPPWYFSRCSFSHLLITYMWMANW